MLPKPQYQNIFGGFTSGAYTPDAVYGYFNNGGGPCYVSSIKALKEADASAVAASVTIPPVGGKGKGMTVTAKLAGESGNDLAVIINNDSEGDTFTMSVGGETHANLTMKKGDSYVGNVEFTAVTIPDLGTAALVEGTYRLEGGGSAPLTAADFIGDVSKRTGLGGLEAFEDILQMKDRMHLKVLNAIT